MEQIDLLIVGAGISGLSMAKTFKEVNPYATMLIVERGASIGGIWSEERQYPSLKTNNHYGSFEFSDLPMFAREQDTGHIPGPAVQEYLQQYTEHFNLSRYISFGTTVLSAEDLGSQGWLISARSVASGSLRRIKASKLVVASGLLSEPLMPSFPDQAIFGRPIVHSSQFAQHSKTWSSHRSIVVFGGAKFSWDVASVFASHGVQVDWVIRSDGHGPCWMSPSKLTPLKIVPENLLATRFVTWFSPCAWGDADGFTGLRNFLHRTWLGKLLVWLFFFKAASEVLQHNAYDEHPETKKLKPKDELFWVGTNRGIMNYEHNIMQQVRDGKIRVHVADVKRLSEGTVHLSDGKVLPADMIICGTGWTQEPSFKFISQRDLGVPGSTPSNGSSNPKSREHYSTQAARADAELFANFPVLADQPAPTCKASANALAAAGGGKEEPWRLYRFMVPPSTVQHRTLAFAGALRSPLTTLITQAQALWICAYFSHALPHLEALGRDAEPAAARDALLHSRFLKWRYPHGFGGKLPDIWLDSLPYVDLMLAELGLRRWRKASLWKECFEPYGVKDYVGLVDEWKAAVAWSPATRRQRDEEHVRDDNEEEEDDNGYSDGDDVEMTESSSDGDASTEEDGELLLEEEKRDGEQRTSDPQHHRRRRRQRQRQPHVRPTTVVLR